MGFYGNITHSTRSSFVFDKIYPNRAEMDAECNKFHEMIINDEDAGFFGDGVYIGRYVLVSYDSELELDNYLMVYKCYDKILGSTITDFAPNKYYQFTSKYIKRTEQNADKSGNILEDFDAELIDSAKVLIRDKNGKPIFAKKLDANTYYALPGKFSFYAVNGPHKVQTEVIKKKDLSFTKFLMDQDIADEDQALYLAENIEDESIAFIFNEADKIIQRPIYTKVQIAEEDYYIPFAKENPEEEVTKEDFAKQTFYIYDVKNDRYIKASKFDEDKKNDYYVVNPIYYVDQNGTPAAGAFDDQRQYFTQSFDYVEGLFYIPPHTSLADVDEWYNEENPGTYELELYAYKGYDPLTMTLNITAISIPALHNDNFNTNYLIDKEMYPSAGRGYDGTVWQKVYVPGQGDSAGVEKYVMIAELNTVVPTFDLEADAPTISPILPHFDEDSTNVYYKLHYQPQWGFRIKGASPLANGRAVDKEGNKINVPLVYSEDEREYPSDVDVVWTSQVYQNGRTTPLALKYDKKKNEGEWAYENGDSYKYAQPAAIYFNKDGFDPTSIVKSYDYYYSGWKDNQVTDEISVTPTGLSGQLYNRHDGTNIKAPAPDSQELSIILPSIGDAISDVWDLVYGGRKDNNRARFVEIDSSTFNEEKFNQGAYYVRLDDGRFVPAPMTYNPNQKYFRMITNRNLDIYWEDAGDNIQRNGLRLVDDLSRRYYEVQNLQVGDSVEGYYEWDIELDDYKIITDSKRTYQEGDFPYYRKVENGFTYNNDNKINTIAGVINSVHDLMGMIIVDDTNGVKYTADSGFVDQDHIYYINGEYYILKYRDNYEIGDTVFTDNDYVFNETDMVRNEGDFQCDLFYTIDGTPIKEYPSADGKYYLKTLNSDDKYFKLENENSLDDFNIGGPYYKETKGLEYIVQSKPEYEQYYSTIDRDELMNHRIDLINYEPNKYFKRELDEDGVLQRLTLLEDKSLPIGRYDSGEPVILSKIVGSTPQINFSYSLDEFGNIDSPPIYPFVPWLFAADLQFDDDGNWDKTKPFTFLQEPDDLLKYNKDTIFYMFESMYDLGSNDSAWNPDPENPGQIKPTNASAYWEFDNPTPVKLFIPNEDDNYYKLTPNSKQVNDQDFVYYTDYELFGHGHSVVSAYYLNIFNTHGVQQFDPYSMEPEAYLARNLYWQQVKEFVIQDQRGGNLFLIESEDKTIYESGKYYKEDFKKGAYIKIVGQPSILENAYFYNRDTQNYELVGPNREYNPEETYYTLYGSYIKDYSSEIADINTTYYTEISAVKTDRFFYVPSKYYVKEDGIYRLDKTNNWRDVLYHKLAPTYVYEDTANVYQQGAKWYSNYIPHTITLVKAKEERVLVPLKGFARDFNTIHGLLIRLNNLLELTHTDTRDVTTVQGCINRMNDIINSFDNLEPGKIMIVDDYSRLHGASYSTAQEYSYKNFGTLEEDAENLVEDRYLQLDISTNVTEADGTTLAEPQFTIQHRFTAQDDTTTISDKNIALTNIPDDFDKLGLNNNTFDKIELYTPIVDNLGHIVGNNKETITLPFGFKTVTATNSSAEDYWSHSSNKKSENENVKNIVADNITDTLNLVGGNKWLRFKSDAVNGANTNSLTSADATNTLTIAHETHEITVNTAVATDLNNGTDTIVLTDFYFDKAGHLDNKTQHTYTLPYGYKSFTGDSGESTADRTQDSFSITGDTWVTTAVSNDAIALAHSAPHTTAAQNLSAVEPKFGETFTIEDWSFDDKGHKANKSTHTVKIPQGSLTDKVAKTSANVVTDISFAPATGLITVDRTNIGALLITDYSVGADTSGKLAATDSLNTALGKLQGQINGMDVDSLSNIDGKVLINISESDGKISAVNKELGDIQLGNYTNIATGGSLISASTTLANAIKTLDGRIYAEEEARKTAVSNLKATGAASISASKTISSWSESNGIVSIETQDISIASSQINNLATTYDANGEVAVTGKSIAAALDTLGSMAEEDSTEYTKTDSIRNLEFVYVEADEEEDIDEEVISLANLVKKVAELEARIKELEGIK